MITFLTAVLLAQGSSAAITNLKCYVLDVRTRAQLDITIPYDSDSGVISSPVSIVARGSYKVGNQTASPQFILRNGVTGTVETVKQSGCSVRAFVHGGDGSRISICHRDGVRDSDAVTLELAPGKVNQFLHELRGYDPERPSAPRSPALRPYVADCPADGFVS